MAPFRASARSNRSGRLQAENDVFEGLPVRQWRQGEGTFGLPPPAVVQQDKDLIFPELKMPRDSHLLAPWTQQLLREARKPRSAKRKVEQTEDVKPEDDEDQKEGQHHNGWMAKKWSQIPRQNEEPEPEYLAKRRKGLPSSYIEAPAFVPQIATRTAKVRKTDASGQEIVYEVIVPEGQTIEGEVKDEDVSMLEVPSLAPGTVVEGVGVANAEGQVVANDLLQPTPSRRRKPPPPKRKGGPGRGKKKVMFQPTTSDGQPAGVGTLATTTDGATPSGNNANGNDANGANGEGEGDDDDGEDGEDGEEGEDGDEGDDEDREDGELSDGEGGADSSAEQGMESQPPPDGAAAADVTMPDAEVPAPASEAVPVETTDLPALSTTTNLEPPMEPIEPTPTPVEPVALSMPAVPAQPQDTLPGLDTEPKADTAAEAPEVGTDDAPPQEATAIPGLETAPPATSDIAATTSVTGSDVEMSNNAPADPAAIAQPELSEVQAEATLDTAPAVAEPQETTITEEVPPRPDPLSIEAITEPPSAETTAPGQAPLDIPPVSAAADAPPPAAPNDAPPTASIPAIADAPTLPAVVEANPAPPAAEPEAEDGERHAVPIADLLAPAPAAEELPKEDGAAAAPAVEGEEQATA